MVQAKIQRKDSASGAVSNWYKKFYNIECREAGMAFKPDFSDCCSICTTFA